MEYQSEIGEVATSFAQVSSSAVAASNAQRLQIAEGNIQAATNQINLERDVNRREVARSLAKFAGEQAAARAFRGGGSVGSGTAIGDAATAQAADQTAIIEANAANKVIAAKAANQVVLDDPVLAAIQGGIEGVNIGTQIAQSLLSEAEVTQWQSSQQIDVGGGIGWYHIPTYQNTITNLLNVPGFNINDFLQGFDFGLNDTP